MLASLTTKVYPPAHLPVKEDPVWVPVPVVQVNEYGPVPPFALPAKAPLQALKQVNEVVATDADNVSGAASAIIVC